jgi:hypothetical protein
MEDFLLYIVIIGLFAGIVYAMVQFIYVRHAKTYLVEIKAYLSRHGFTLKEKRLPLRTDWSEGPFKKPPAIRVSLGTVKVLGYSMPMSDEKYYVIETNEGETLWLRIETMFLSKPILTFKRVEKPIPLRTKKDIGNQPTAPCPACSFLLIESDTVCPDCGLNLK